MITPDREINPPDDKHKTCVVCNGRTKVVPSNWDYDEDGDPEEEDLERCDECNGEGYVPIEDWEAEW